MRNTGVPTKAEQENGKAWLALLLTITLGRRYTSNADYLLDISTYVDQDISGYAPLKGPQVVSQYNTAQAIACYTERIDAPVKTGPNVLWMHVDSYKAESPVNKTAKLCVTHTLMIGSRLFLISGRGKAVEIQSAANEFC